MMNRELDGDSKRILKTLKEADEPLETKELELILKNITRVKLLYRLNNLRGEGLVKGKQVGSGKGTWIWWEIKKK
jgi:hypothetical protein